MDSWDVVIVGGGVRSVVLLERILAVAAARRPDRALRIAVVDPWPPGAGRIWRSDQPLALVMNTLASAATVFPDPSVRIAGEILCGPSLLEWCAVVAGRVPDRSLPDDAIGSIRRAAGGLDDGLRHAAAALRPWEYAPRALFGAYLRWAFADLAARLRETGAGRVDHIARGAIDIRDDAGASVVRLSDGAEIGARGVVLALGWLLGTADAGADAAARTPDVLAADSPIDQPLDRVPDGGRVLLRGLGMSFFDTVTLLTVGRGGRFESEGEPGDRVRYRASGREPRILASSRGGAPFRAQARHTAVPDPVRLDLFQRGVARGDEFADLLRALGRDADRAYYRVLARVDPDAVMDPEALADAADPDGTTDAEWAAVVAAAVPDPGLRFDARRFDATPFRADGDEDYAHWFARHLEADLAEARRGRDSPVKAALAHFVAARSRMPDIAGFGRLGDQHPLFLDYLRFAGRAGGVPPEFRVRELRALVAAGVVRPWGPDPTVERMPDGRLRSVAGGAHEDVDAVIEAHLPPRVVAGSGSRLVRALHARGIVRAWTMAGVETGSLDIDAHTGALVGADGTRHPRIHSVGTPSEDARVFTIIAPIPGTDSPVIREADAVVRALAGMW